MDKFLDECGILGLSIPKEKHTASLAYFGLNGLQHRGQVSAGIAVSNDDEISCFKDYGLVTDIFDEHILSILKGDLCLGHVSQDTNSNVLNNNAQPFVANYKKGTVAIAFNGGLINGKEIRREMEEQGAIFTTTSESEILSHCIINTKETDIVKAVRTAIKRLRGGYAFAVMTQNAIIATRDPLGIRPLVIGSLEGGCVVSSESCAIDLMGGELIRDVEPGEIVVLSGGTVESYPNPNQEDHRASCAFEYIYFARPDSTIDQRSVYLSREHAGRILAGEHYVSADVVIGVPDSGTPAATGYAAESGIPYSASLIKNKYIGRTFVEATQEKREVSVKIKLNPTKEIVNGKKVVLVDDSIVRGTTMRKIIASIRELGATQVHLRISSPPVYSGCPFGVIAPKASELIANTHSMDEIAEMLGADSVQYISVEGLLKSVKSVGNDFCTGCFDRKYPAV